MGKIRVKTLGNEQAEQQQKKEAKKRKEEKLTKVPNLKGGQRLTSVGPTEEELTKMETPAETKEVKKTEEKKEEKQKQKKSSYKEKIAKKQTRSQKYLSARKQIDQTKFYPIQDALELLPKVAIASFDETVELHINTIDRSVSGNITLPHGNGKKTRVAIATDELIEKLEKSLPANASPSGDGRRGKIDFDVLIAHPSLMPKLAKVAKFLGPRGLMPNPKNGTISQNPQETAKKYEMGQISIKTEAKSPIIHLSVGKVSFGKEKLEENIKTVFSAIQREKIQSVTLKSTMSPGIKLHLPSV